MLYQGQPAFFIGRPIYVLPHLEFCLLPLRHHYSLTIPVQACMIVIQLIQNNMNSKSTAMTTSHGARSRIHSNFFSFPQTFHCFVRRISTACSSFHDMWNRQLNPSINKSIHFNCYVPLNLIKEVMFRDS